MVSQLLNSADALLPALLGKTPQGEHGLCFNLHIPASLEFFVGHFPGYPIVPGVAQVDWAIKLIGLHLPSVQKIALKKLKFQRPMSPGHRVALIIHFDPEKPALRFSYQGESWEYSSGEIHWDSTYVKSLCRDTCL